MDKKALIEAAFLVIQDKLSIVILYNKSYECKVLHFGTSTQVWIGDYVVNLYYEPNPYTYQIINNNLVELKG